MNAFAVQASLTRARDRLLAQLRPRPQVQYTIEYTVRPAEQTVGMPEMTMEELTALIVTNPATPRRPPAG